MRKPFPCRAGLLGLTLLLGCLGVTGDQRPASGGPRDPTLRVSDQQGLVEAFRKRPPRAEIPLLRGLHLVEVGPDGMTLEIQAEAVSRWPRRVGLVTYRSFHELVAANLRVRMLGAQASGHTTPSSASTPDVFAQLQGTLGTLQALAQEGARGAPDPQHLFAQTFLTGAVIEGFLLEMAERTGIGRLWSQRLLPTTDGRGWSLRGVVIEGRQGGRLTIAEATWVGAGRLVATGPYTWVRGRRSRAGSQGCFLVEVRGGLRVRDLTAARDRVLDCASTRLPPTGGDGPGALVSGLPLEPMLPFLALLPSVPPRGPRAARLTQWLLPSLTPGLPRSATGRAREGPDSPE